MLAKCISQGMCDLDSKVSLNEVLAYSFETTVKVG